MINLMALVGGFAALVFVIYSIRLHKQAQKLARQRFRERWVGNLCEVLTAAGPAVSRQELEKIIAWAGDYEDAELDAFNGCGEWFS